MLMGVRRTAIAVSAIVALHTGPAIAEPRPSAVPRTTPAPAKPTSPAIKPVAPRAEGPALDEALDRGASALAPLTIKCMPGADERTTFTDMSGRTHPLFERPVRWMAVLEYRPAPQPISSRALEPGECGMQESTLPEAIRQVFLYRFQADSPDDPEGDRVFVHLNAASGRMRSAVADQTLTRLVERSTDWWGGTPRQFTITARPVRCFHACELAVTPSGGFSVETVR